MADKTRPDTITTTREETTTHGDEVRKGVLQGHREFGDIDYSTHRSHEQPSHAEQDALNASFMNNQQGHPILGQTQAFDGAATEEITAQAEADRNPEAQEKLENKKRLEASLKVQQQFQLQQMTTLRRG